MNHFQSNVRAFSNEGIISTHAVLRNTYFLLGLSLLFSSFTAYYSIITFAQPGLMTFIGSFALLFAVHAFANSGLGIILTFAFTGLMGYSLGPMLSSILASPAGSLIVFMALFCTASIFIALSAYVLITRENFTYMGGFLFTGIVIACITSLGAVLFNFPLLHLITSAAFTVISSGLIMFHTSNIIHGGERNYVLATISLYIALYNIFVSLLHIFSALSGRD